MMMHRVHCAVPVGTAILGGLLTTESIQAQVLPPAIYSVYTRGSFGHVEHATSGAPMTLHNDWIGEYTSLQNGQWVPFISYSMQAWAEAFGGARPQAVATAEAHGVSLVAPIQFDCEASAGIEYSARLRPTAPPPGGAVDVPVRVHVRGHASGSATSTVILFNFYNFGVTSTSTLQEFDTSLDLLLPSDGSVDVPVRLIAQAQAYEFRLGNWPHSSQALADPLFELNQSAFDQQMGAATYPLADYFNFEYSMGIVDMPAVCDPTDFNNDGLFPDTADVDDFLSVFSGGPCSNDPSCGDIDFNNDGLFPDTLDIDSLLSVFSGGPCL